MEGRWREKKMQSNTMSKFKWFWAWQDDKEEVWLQDMSRQGWHLARPNPLGAYDFVRGEPKEYVYRLDFQSGSRGRDEYRQLFADAGWEHVGEMAGWQYFRKEVQPGEEAEIFTDNESKIAKYRRLLGYLALFLPIWVVTLSDLGSSRPGPIGTIRLGLSAILVLVYTAVFVCVLRRIRELKTRY
jgi:hypothetical protein